MFWRTSPTPLAPLRQPGAFFTQGGVIAVAVGAEWIGVLSLAPAVFGDELRKRTSEGPIGQFEDWSRGEFVNRAKAQNCYRLGIRRHL